MFRGEFYRKVLEDLRANDIRKPVTVKKHSFYITDDEGNKANFQVKQQDKEVLYNLTDVTNIMDACIRVVTESIKNGEPISIRGFGVMGLNYRKARRTKEPMTDNWVDVEARYVPKFYPGNDLKIAARMYEYSLKEKGDYNDLIADEEYDDLDDLPQDGGDE